MGMACVDRTTPLNHIPWTDPDSDDCTFHEKNVDACTHWGVLEGAADIAANHAYCACLRGRKAWRGALAGRGAVRRRGAVHRRGHQAPASARRRLLRAGQTLAARGVAGHAVRRARLGRGAGDRPRARREKTGSPSPTRTLPALTQTSVDPTPPSCTNSSTRGTTLAASTTTTDEPNHRGRGGRSTPPASGSSLGRTSCHSKSKFVRGAPTFRFLVFSMTCTCTHQPPTQDVWLLSCA